MKKFIILYITLFIGITSVSASDWKQLSDNFWIDSSSINYLNRFGTYRLWLKWANPNYNAKNINLPNIKTETYCNSLPTDAQKETCLAERSIEINKARFTKNIMAYTEIDCNRRQYKTIDMILLDDKNEILERKTSIIPKAFWSNVIPETKSQYAYNEVCK